MSIKAIEVIDRLPNECAARLTADEFFSDIAIVVADEGNVLATMNRLQAALTTKTGKRGVAVIVLQVVGNDEMAEVKFGPLRLFQSFQVVENRELNLDANGTGKSARKVARRIVDVVKSLRLDGLTTDWVPDRPCIEPLNLKKELGASIVGYQVNFWTLEADTEAVEQVSAPTFSDVNNMVALSCATAGAEIWFTTDDSPPMPTRTNVDSTATVYTDPIAVPVGGVIIRAAAFRAGLIGSTISRAEVSQV